MNPPAHKSGTAGQIVNEIPKELIYQGTTVYAPPKTALEASKAVLAPYPQESAEVRLNRLVGALEKLCSYSETVEATLRPRGMARVSDIRKIIKENT